MDKLTYDTLQNFARTKGDHLELVEIDAVRLRDDRSEIRPGDEVAFVATAKLRLTRDGLSQVRAELPEYKPLLKDLAEGDDLLEIRNDAEVTSPLPIDSDGVKKWLADYYAFTFLLDGDSSHPFRTIGRHDSAVPWVQTLNTGIVRSDYFDVGVRIEHPDTPSPPPEAPIRKTVASVAELDLDLDHAQLQLMLAIEAPYATVAELQGKTFWIPMQPEHDNVRLVVTVRKVITKTDEPTKLKSQDRNR